MFGWLIGRRKEKFVIEEMNNGLFRARVKGSFYKCLSMYSPRDICGLMDISCGRVVMGTLEVVEHAVKEHYSLLERAKQKRKDSARVRFKRFIKNM